MSTPYCRYIRTNGRRCCSIAIRGQSLCYFHRNVNARMRSVNNPAKPSDYPLVLGDQNTVAERQRNSLLNEYYEGIPPRSPLQLDFPPLEDRESIQIALSMLLSALAQNRIEPKRASTMLYGLQVASSNAANFRSILGVDKAVTATVVDDQGVELSEDEDPLEIAEFNEWLEDQNANEDSEDDEDDSDDDV